MQAEKKNPIKEIMIGLFIAVVGGILVVHYQEGLHKNKIEERNETTSPTPAPNIESSNVKPDSLPFTNSDANTQDNQTVSQTERDNPQPENRVEKIKPVEANSTLEDDGLSIKIIDAITQKPVAGVSISFSGFPNVLTSNQNGIFIIPKSIIAKRGEYNSVRAYFTQNGFEPVDYEIGLSESQTFKINKSQ